MAKTKGTPRGIITPTKVSPIWQIGILFPDGKKIVKPKCTLNDIFNTYFLNLDNLIKSYKDPEELLIKYEENYKNKNIKVQICYIDSWGHKWKGKVAWPKRDKFINFLNNKINND